MNKLLQSLLCTCIACLQMQGAVVNIDFNGASGAYSGAGIASDAGTYWNISSTSFSNLLESDGLTSSGISLSTSGFSQLFANSGNALLADRIITAYAGVGTVASIALSGLEPGQPVDLYFYNGFYAQRYSVASVGSTDVIPVPGSNNLSLGSWVEGREYGVLENALANSTGQLTISVTALDNYPSDDRPTIAGMQIVTQPIPEPATPAALLGLATFLACGPRKGSQPTPHRRTA